jgi:hypothetical protein
LDREIPLPTLFFGLELELCIIIDLYWSAIIKPSVVYAEQSSPVKNPSPRPNRIKKKTQKPNSNLLILYIPVSQIHVFL